MFRGSESESSVAITREKCGKIARKCALDLQIKLSAKSGPSRLRFTRSAAGNVLTWQKRRFHGSVAPTNATGQPEAACSEVRSLMEAGKVALLQPFSRP